MLPINNQERWPGRFPAKFPAQHVQGPVVMALLGTDSETILDTSGQAAPSHVSAFVRALDRLLTVGAYYADGHDQYLRATATAAAAMTAAIGARAWLALEVSAAGLIVDGITVDPRQRAARQVHDLLVALDIASLSFSPQMTAADLRIALSAMQAHRLARQQAHSFRALALEGLPPTVSAANRRLQAVAGRDDDDDDGGDGGDGGDGANDAAGGSGAGGDGHDTGTLRAGNDLLDLLRRVVAQPAPGDGGAGTGPHRSTAPAAPTTPATLSAGDAAAIRDCVARLLDRDTGTADLAELLELAAQALALGGAPASMRLAFEQLRRQVEAAAADAAAPDPRLEDHAWPLEDLAGRVASLARRLDATGDPVAEARRDQVAICFRLLANGSQDDAFTPALAILETGCGAARPGAADIALYASALSSLATTTAAAELDRALPQLLAGLRAAHPDLPARVWAAVADDLATPALAALWPHLVSDLSLGLEPAEPETIARCCRLAASLDAAEAASQLPRFLALPGARRAAVSRQVFLLPPQRAYGLHAALLKGAAASRHAANLLRELRRRPPDELTGFVLAALDGDAAVDADLLLEILREAGQGGPSPRFRAFAAALLSDALEALPAARRDEAWVAGTIGWLARHAPARAGELLRRVATERAWLLRPAWPQACRTAARATAPAGGD